MVFIITLLCLPFRELLECFLDASRIEEAKDFASTAAEFIKENAPKKYKTLFSLMVTFEV